VSADTVGRPWSRGARRALQVAAPLWLRAHDMHIEGAERLPIRRERLLLACNHTAFADTVHLAAAIGPRFVVIGGHPRLFRDPARRAIMGVGQILRVDDEAQLVRDGVALLDRGELVLAYPELGRRPEGLGSFSPAIARVALTAGVAILPLRLSAAGQRPVRLWVGHRLAAVGDPGSLTAELRRAIADLGR
jgi:1-acyl-sn-glycerol-3-phosphate acyltransferase